MAECNKLSNKEELQEPEELTERKHRQANKEYIVKICGELMEFPRTGYFDLM